MEARCQAISSLAVLNVDPALTAHATNVVAAGIEVAEVFNDAANALEQAKGLTSDEDLLIDFILSLVRHANVIAKRKGNGTISTTDYADDADGRGIGIRVIRVIRG